MKSLSSSFVCVQRTPKPPQDELIVWAQAVVKNPAEFYATDRERSIVASLLAEATR